MIKSFLHYILLGLLGAWLFAVPLQAHGGGGLPYIQINGEYVDENPFYGISKSPALPLAKDIAEGQGFIFGELIVFDVDVARFPAANEQAQNMFGLPVQNQVKTATPLFRWNFGDGSEIKEGINITHLYAAPGTYNVTLEVKFPGKSDDYVEANTIQVVVLPSKTYEMPVAKIVLNGNPVSDSQRGAITVNPRTNVLFDGSGSAGHIKTYEWDFGDHQISNEVAPHHAFGRNDHYPVVMLRVRDENNITSDSVVLLTIPIIKSNLFNTIYYEIYDFIVGLFS